MKTKVVSGTFITLPYSLIKNNIAIINIICAWITIDTNYSVAQKSKLSFMKWDLLIAFLSFQEKNRKLNASFHNKIRKKKRK